MNWEFWTGLEVATANIQVLMTWPITYLIFKVHIALGVRLWTSFPLAIFIYYKRTTKMSRGWAKNFCSEPRSKVQRRIEAENGYGKRSEVISNPGLRTGASFSELKTLQKCWREAIASPCFTVVLRLCPRPGESLLESGGYWLPKRLRSLARYWQFGSKRHYHLD